MSEPQPVFQNPYFSPAKINLFLHILGRRVDGYHELESLVYFTEFGDYITIRESDGFDLSFSGPYGDILKQDAEQQPNLVAKAVKMLEDLSGRRFPLEVHIEKNIPLGGGLGGGSSNAATVLKAIKNAYDLDHDLTKITSALGSDLTAFLYAPQPVMMRGTGNEITPLPHDFLPKFQIILDNCGRPCSTADVYRNFSGATGHPFTLPDRFLSLDDFIGFLNTQTRNDLTLPALKICPEIWQSLKRLKGHPDNLLTRMSGSGATCFSIQKA